MKRIAFILDHKLHHYRIPFFEELGYTIDIYHPGPLNEDFKDNKHISQKIMKPRWIFNKLFFYSLPSFKEYDIVICMQNIRMLNLWTLTLNPFRNYKLIHWGIGASSASGLPQSANFVSRIRNFLSHKANALVFYSAYPTQFYSHKTRSKIFIANNTVANPLSCDTSESEKKYFLFLGSINRRKGLDTLLRVFNSYLKKSKEQNATTIYSLIIAGGGNKQIITSLKEYASTNNILDKIKFTGSVYSNEKKRELFSSAVACISPKQAGLSVLESFSYGVPFIAFKDAISGGEHLNIENGYTGFLVNNEEELVERMLFLSEKGQQSTQIGRNAYSFYTRKRSINNMVQGFEKAITFSLEQ